MNKIKLIITGASPVYLLGLETMLESVGNVEISAKVFNQKNLLKQVSLHQPDVIIVDSNLLVDREILFINEIKEIKAKVLLLAKEDADINIRLIEEGVEGCVLKNADCDEIVLAIKSLAKGGSYFCEAVSNKLIARKSSNKTKKEIRLTDREFEILKFVADEFSNKEIAEKLYISHRTVETHKRNLIHKLKVKGTVGLVKHYFSFAQK